MTAVVLSSGQAYRCLVVVTKDRVQHVNPSSSPIPDKFAASLHARVSTTKLSALWCGRIAGSVHEATTSTPMIKVRESRPLVRRVPGGEEHLVRGASRGAVRVPRAERRRQDHHHQDAHHAALAHAAAPSASTGWTRAKHQNEVRRRFGIVFQDPSLDSRAHRLREHGAARRALRRAAQSCARSASSS